MTSIMRTDSTGQETLLVAFITGNMLLLYLFYPWLNAGCAERPR